MLTKTIAALFLVAGLANAATMAFTSIQAETPEPSAAAMILSGFGLIAIRFYKRG